ncbi:MAG: xylB [Clostridia bacterium]|nr:xylB [Clostridia bacterium]
MIQYLLAHDLGTSGNKATLFDTEGKLIKSIVRAYDVHYFNNNWAEQDPDDWWRAVCETTQEIVKGMDKSKIAAVSFSGQMMGCLCVDREGKPLRKSIIWADQRAVKEAAFLEQEIGNKKYYRITGHRISPSYGLQKLMWIKNNEPEIYRETYKVLNSKDYIIFKLTGKFVTDYSDATGTCMLDLNTYRWSDELIMRSGIDGNKLPELHKSTSIIGGVSEQAAVLTGLEAGTPVVCGGGDGVCATVGAGCIKEGSAYSIVGSSAWISMTTKEPIFDESMRTFNWAHIISEHVAPCGTMQAAGVSYNWLKNEVCMHETEEAKKLGISPYEIINKRIKNSPAGANGLIFLPYLLGERSPRWNPNARGAFIGLTAAHKREDLLRSVLEGITMNLNVILDVFKEYYDIKELIVIGGGAKGEVWRQIMADIYNLKIITPNYLEEATSMGAAVTGGVGVGIFKDFNVIEKFIEIKNIEEPIIENNECYQKLMPIFDESYNALVHVYEKLAEL